MKNIIIFALFLLLPLTSFATVFEDPTVTLDGKTYRLVDSNFKTGEMYPTPDGFCKRNGFDAYTWVNVSTNDFGPGIVLDDVGNPVATIDNNAEGNFWIATEINCVNF